MSSFMQEAAFGVRGSRGEPQEGNTQKRGGLKSAAVEPAGISAVAAGDACGFSGVVAPMQSQGFRSYLSTRWPAWTCALLGLFVFQVFGNLSRGYIDSASLFVWWGRQWLDPRSELQHAWVLLALALFLFIRKGRELAAPVQPAATVPAERESRAWLLPLSLGLHGIGLWLQQPRLSILALLLFVWGLARLLGGRAWAKAALFPLLLLLFTLPAGFFDMAGFWLRLSVVEISQSLLGLLGVEVRRAGTQLFDPSCRFQYDVVAACSGVRSLQAILALSLVLGYLRLGPLGARVLCVLLVLPWLYLANLLRILAIVLASVWWGAEAGTRVHSWSGPLVFTGVLCLVFLSLRFLLWWRPAWALREASTMISSGPQRAGGALLLTSLSALLIGGLYFWLSAASQTPRCGLLLAEDGRHPAPLPAFLGQNWGGRSLEVTRAELETLPPDTGFARRLYHDLDHPERKVLLSVILSGKDRSSIHRPELCLVAQGWSLRGGEKRQLKVGGRFLDVSLLRVERQSLGGGKPIPGLVAYFFVGAESIESSQVSMYMRDVFARARGKPERWAYVLVQADAWAGEEELLKAFENVLSGAIAEKLLAGQVR